MLTLASTMRCLYVHFQTKQVLKGKSTSQSARDSTRALLNSGASRNHDGINLSVNIRKLKNTMQRLVRETSVEIDVILRYR